MKAINIIKVLDYLKSKKTKIGAIILIISVIFLIGYKVQEYFLIQKAKTNLLEENKELIFFNGESIENKEKIQTINSKIEFLYKELDATKSYDECVEVQLDRLATGQPVDLEYCEKFNDIIEEVEKEETILQEEKIDYNLKETLDVNKEILFLCKEVGADDPERCATYGTLVYNYESGKGTSRRCLEDNNCYGIKNPTDKAGLKGDYKIGTGRHLIFETKEIGSYAFAYYYSNYHIQRNAKEFVNRWAGWNNERYISYITQNYDALYNKYQNFLTFTK